MSEIPQWLMKRCSQKGQSTADVVLLRPLTWLNEQRSGKSRLPGGTFAARRTHA